MNITFTKYYNESEHRLYMTGILSYHEEDSYIAIVTRYDMAVGIAFILNPTSPTPVLRWGSNAVFHDDCSTYDCHWATIGVVIDDFQSFKTFLPTSFDESCHGLNLPSTSPYGIFINEKEPRSVISQLKQSPKYHARFERFVREMLRQHQWLDCTMSGHIQCPQIQIGGDDQP